MRREELIGWLFWGGVSLLVAALAVALLALVIGAVPILVAVFPLSLSAVAVFLAIGCWKSRRR